MIDLMKRSVSDAGIMINKIRIIVLVKIFGSLKIWVGFD